MICSSGNVDSNRLRTGSMTEEDWNRFTIAVGKLSRTKIFIDDTPGFVLPIYVQNVAVSNKNTA